jgi:hypothetical protein
MPTPPHQAANDLVYLCQQLSSVCERSSCQRGNSSVAAQSGAYLPTPQHGQEHEQQPVCCVVLQTCTAFCRALSAALSATPHPHQQRRKQQHQGSKWRPQRQSQQQEPPPPPPQVQLLPSSVATALCFCLRQWSNTGGIACSDGGQVCCQCCRQQQAALQLGAVSALGALLPAQLPAVAAFERTAVLTLLLALAQPPSSQGAWRSSSSGGGGGSGGGMLQASPNGHAAGLQPSPAQPQQQQQQQQQQSSNGASSSCGADEDWALCSAAVGVLSALLHSGGNSSKSSTNSYSCSMALRADEVAAVLGSLVEALSTACGTRGGGSGSGSGSSSGSSSSSRPGSMAGAPCAGGMSSSGSGAANSSRHLPIEGLQQSRYLAVLLTALNHLVAEQQASWQSHAGTLTEAACKLMTYGSSTHQQQQQQQPAGADGFTAGGASHVLQPPAPAVGPAAAAAGRAHYVPPHLRKARAAAAAGAAGAALHSQQQQQQQALSDESEQSASDLSDTESCTSSSSSGWRHSAARTQQQEQQQQQQQLLHDPIRAVRVRVALLQLLQSLVRVDPAALHPYWAALLPSQAPLALRPWSPHLVTVLLHDHSDRVRLVRAWAVDARDMAVHVPFPHGTDQYCCCARTQVRVLAAAVLGALLEGAAARALLAVAR